MKSGDEVTGDNGMTFRLEAMLAYQGKDGCQDMRCRRTGYNAATGDFGQCIGYHCPTCDAPCSMMGHARCQEQS